MLPNRNNLPVKGLLLRFFSTFVGELRNLGSRHMKKEEALCSSSIWKRRKFSNCILRWHSGSHAKRGLLLLHLHKRFPTTFTWTWHSWLTFFHYKFNPPIEPMGNYYKYE